MNTIKSTAEAPPPEGTCYQHDRDMLITRIVGCIFFLVMGVGSFCTAFWNTDGSFEYPKITGIGMGLFWLCLVLLSAWMIAGYYRDRLFVKADAIVQQGLIYKRTVNVADAEWVRWKPSNTGGGVDIDDGKTKICIRLGDFTRIEQKQLIASLHHMFAEDVQHDWERFSKHYFLPSKPTKSPWTAVACALSLFAGATGLTCAWIAYVGGVWLVLGMLLACGGVWYLWRALNFTPDDSHESPRGRGG